MQTAISQRACRRYPYLESFAVEAGSRAAHSFSRTAKQPLSSDEEIELLAKVLNDSEKVLSSAALAAPASRGLIELSW